jgi:hypothetical protein
VIQEPPGGPPDFAAPIILSVSPDSGSVQQDFDDPMKIQFDEVISEASGGGLANLVTVSPRPRQVRVTWHRSSINVKPADGWRPDLVYHVVLAPGITDLRNNRMEQGFTVIFSTGGEIPDTRLSGTVLDWEGGRPGGLALVEAVLLPDSLVYVSRADSSGEFAFTALPRGTYTVSAAIDGNSNGRIDPRDAFDSVTITLDSAATHPFWTFTHDTAGPQLSQADRVDSITARLQFDQMLLPAEPEAAAVRAWALPDTTPVAVAAVLRPDVFDSLRTAEQAAADSARAAVDSAAAARDTVPVDTTRVGLPGRERRPRGQPAAPPAEAVQDSTTRADTSRAQRLLAERPALSNLWYVRMEQSLVPGGRYLFEAAAQGIAGATAESRAVLVMPEPLPAALPDSLGPERPDSVAPPDSVPAAPADTSGSGPQ